MNPLNRRMFRDPRAARRATGILASSAPLMTAAQKAMAQGQPVKAQTGASVNTGGGRFGNRFDSTDQVPILRFFQGNTPVPNTPQISRSSGFVQGSIADTLFNALRPMGYGAQGGTMQQRREFEKMRPYLEAGADRTAPSGLPLDRYALRGTMPGPGAGITSVLSDNLSDMEMQNRQPRFLGTDEDVPYGRTAEDATGGGGVPLDDAQRLLLKKKREQRATVSDSTIPSDAAPGAGETLAQGTTSAAVSAVDDALDARKDTQEVITPDSVGPQAEPDAAADIAAAKKKRSEGKGVSATQDQAAQNDKDLGIDPELSRKERVEQRYNLLKDLIGEDQAKDVRTDKNYNLMMLGLRIAAGQSEDALSNIAVGAGQQLEAFGEVKGEETQRAAERDLSIKMQAANEVGQEIAAEEERKYQLQRDENDQIFQRAMQDARLGSQEAMAAVQMEWQAASKALDRDLSRDLAASNETLQLQLQKIRSLDSAADREAAFKRLMATHRFQAEQAAEGRIFDLEKLISTQEFAREQGMNEQAFRYNLAAFTASLPTETERFYTNFLDDKQIVEVLMAKVNDTNLDVDVSKFVSEAMKDERRREDGRNEIARQSVIKQNPTLQKDDPDEFQRQVDALIPEINDQQLTTYFTNGYNSVFKRTKTTE